MQDFYNHKKMLPNKDNWCRMFERFCIPAWIIIPSNHWLIWAETTIQIETKWIDTIVLNTSDNGISSPREICRERKTTPNTGNSLLDKSDPDNYHKYMWLLHWTTPTTENSRLDIPTHTIPTNDNSHLNHPTWDNFHQELFTWDRCPAEKLFSWEFRC